MFKVILSYFINLRTGLNTTLLSHWPSHPCCPEHWRTSRSCLEHFGNRTPGLGPALLTRSDFIRSLTNCLCPQTWWPHSNPFFKNMFQIWIWQRDTSNAEAWKCFVFRSKIPLCKFQDLLQHSCGRERRLDYLRFECGRLKHPCGPAGWTDLLCVTAHQHHVPQIQGRQRLHSPRDPLCHRHQRYEGHVRLRSAGRKTDRCELWFQKVSICPCHVIIQHEGSALILMGRRSSDALSCAVSVGSVKSTIGCCLFLPYTPRVC